MVASGLIFARAGMYHKFMLPFPAADGGEFGEREETEGGVIRRGDSGPTSGRKKSG